MSDVNSRYNFTNCFMFILNGEDLGENEVNKTRVLLCKRLSGQCRDVDMAVYFHLHWWWWAVVECAVLYWAELGCTGLHWSLLG